MDAGGLNPWSGRYPHRTARRPFKTADAHRTNAMQKLGIHNSAELAAYAIRHGLID